METMDSFKNVLPEGLSIPAKPYDFSFPPARTALLIIDMQRDFLLEGGFGHIQGGNLESVQASITPTKKLLHAARRAGLSVFHTREGHRPDLSDCPSSKLNRQAAAPGNPQHSKVIGDNGIMGRLLVRGEFGHDIVDGLRPWPSEIVIDKPGKGAFWNTTLMDRLKARGVTHLIVNGVTTECCFATTIREANDRGFECCGIEEATAGYNSEFKACSLDMLHWSQGLFGFVAHLPPLLQCLTSYTSAASLGGSMTPPLSPLAFNGDLSISALGKSYREGLSPVTMVESLLEQIGAYTKVDPAVWIYREPAANVVARAQELQNLYPNPSCRPPLFGIPFSVKDSLDVANVPTTTACPALSRTPTSHAQTVSTLLSHGAIFLGKTNLDQLATGLTGCRSPYGITHSVFDPAFISGGSSSGSCVSVGARLCTFSLATDTAGSGRVPSMFNGVVGFKPTRGILSLRGLTPACARLDCIAIIAHSTADARTVFDVLSSAHDPLDPYSKNPLAVPTTQRAVNATGPESKIFSFGVPPSAVLEEAFCSQDTISNFEDAVIPLLERLGGKLVLETPWQEPFAAASDLLYSGTFVSERLTLLTPEMIEQLSSSSPAGSDDQSKEEPFHPVIRTLLQQVLARHSTAADVYRDLQAQTRYTHQAQQLFAPSSLTVYETTGSSKRLDVLVVPTAPFHPTMAEVLADPINVNSKLGYFTHFGNVLDLCAVATPAGTYHVVKKGESEDIEEQRVTLPFGVTFLGGNGMDAEILSIASRFEEAMVQRG